jgi:hypothetical protein
MFLVNAVIGDIALNLMMHNMTRRKFNPLLQKGLLFIIIPLALILILGLDGQVEQFIIRITTLLACLNFPIKIGLLSR